MIWQPIALMAIYMASLLAATLAYSHTHRQKGKP